MIPPRAAALFALAAAAFAAHLGLGRPASEDRPRPGAAASEGGAALFAGAFRPFVADVLWTRLNARYDARDYEACLPIAEMLLELDPRSEQAWFVMASTLAIDIPGFEDDPSVVWRWRRQGLLVLEEGARRNPGSWFLKSALAMLVDVHVARTSALAERFRRDRTVNPEGLEPIACALRLYREAQEIPRHARYVDFEVDRLASHPLAPRPPN